MQLDAETYFKTDIFRTHKMVRCYYNEFMANIYIQISVCRFQWKVLKLPVTSRGEGWVTFLRFRDHIETTPKLCRLTETSAILSCFSSDNLGIYSRLFPFRSANCCNRFRLCLWEIYKLIFQYNEGIQIITFIGRPNALVYTKLRR
jgi:hypothetical protein